ncbi:RusA family crossover junction endodeoxyribonuclease [uncultured Clostridium sp.]|uniref:RusA family crossover junction endodeoxyribonuclease n=1 Tax=uncultured Clostridium sp. TaxID=59620 RepID=UPI0025F672E4|nr:RusA family crossover junction endodeoxyribonuclease [uncultured Clostridium sp.]
MTDYAKVIIKGSPITKSNFKLHNVNGRTILPDNSGKYHDRYALYEQEIALLARSQNPDVVFSESLIAVLKVYYKSEKRHPDTINITKSIFDGIEKSGLIVNDAQITRIYTEEYYDKDNPRFELELYAESQYNFNFSVTKKDKPCEPRLYNPIRKNTIKNKDEISNSSNSSQLTKNIKSKSSVKDSSAGLCSICKKAVNNDDYIKADGGKTLICKKCFGKLF